MPEPDFLTAMGHLPGVDELIEVTARIEQNGQFKALRFSVPDSDIGLTGIAVYVGMRPAVDAVLVDPVLTPPGLHNWGAKLTDVENTDEYHEPVTISPPSAVAGLGLAWLATRGALLRQNEPRSRYLPTVYEL
ncbi:MAG TPA: hypothetical protein VK674_02815 [Candidatus Limnocylindria bacterium]|nr:hypothetical protein [Candidatus Limnocylindria bacterium]